MRERIEITDIFKASSFLCNGAEILTLKQIGNIITFELESEEISSLERAYNGSSIYKSMGNRCAVCLRVLFSPKM